MFRSALSSACRDELITRNVAKPVEPPRTGNRELKPWTLDETLDVLAASRGDPLYAAFVLAIAMGLRRGEIIGLRWSDLDLDSLLSCGTSLSRRQSATMAAAPSDQARVCLAAPPPALATPPACAVGRMPRPWRLPG